jgi:hypothetical protein
MLEEDEDGGFNWEQEEGEYNWRHVEEGGLEDDADSLDLARGGVRDDQNRGVNLRGPSDSEFFCILFMSDRRNVPDDIIRNGFVPFSKHDYFTWHQIWSLLLARFRSYIQPPKDHRVLKGGFRRPCDYPKALGSQVRILYLVFF